MAKTRRLSAHETRTRLSALGLNRGRRGTFAFEDDARRIGYDFHSHPRHQLIYSMTGIARLECEDAQFLLPPQRAAWIPARLRHATDLNGASVLSIYFDRAGKLPPNEVRVFEVPALVREMLLYARRFPRAGRNARDAEAAIFFRALLLVLGDVIQQRRVYALPRARSPVTARAMEWVLAHLERATLARAAREAGTSARSLRRYFLAETGLAFRAFVNQARVQRGMQLLVAGAKPIIEVAFEVGFRSQSAFTQAFRRSTGTTPRAFRLGP
jgi:AraC-like DNA-binding protein